MSQAEHITTSRCDDEAGGSFDAASLLAESGERYRFQKDAEASTAWDQNLRRSVGVHHMEGEDKELLNRSRLAAHLEHPNILPVHDLATSGDDIVCVVRRMRGETLAERIEHGPIQSKELTQLVFRLESVCDAIAYAHDQGVAHTRISLDAVLLGGFGEVIVTGWLEGKQRKTCTDKEWREAVGIDIRGLGRVLQALTSSADMPPESLSVVSMRALGAASYPTANEFADELRRYRNGYPTQAEEAGFIRTLLLFVSRHRRIAAAASLALIVVAVACLGYGRLLTTQTAALRDAHGKLVEATEQENIARAEAETSLKLLQEQAPVFAQLAQHCINRGELDRAKQLAEQSLLIDPKLVSGYRVLGNWYQTMENHALAAKAYGRAVSLDAEDEASKHGMELSQRLAARQGGPTESDYAELAQYMVQQERESEACRLVDRFKPKLALLKDACGGMLGEHYGGILVDWSPQGRRSLGIAAVTGQADVGKGLERVTRSKIAKYVRRAMLRSAHRLYSIEKLALMPCEEVDICFTDVIDISPLEDKRLRTIGVAFTAVSNLWPLLGHPLVDFDGTANRGISDLEPLRGAPLLNLTANEAAIDDLEPLADAGFRQFVNNAGLSVRECPVFDLRPLRGMVMKDLFLDKTQIEDITPLKDVEMTELWISKTRVRDLTPLANQRKLRKLIITNCTNISDLSPLKNIGSLRFIRLENSGVTDLTPLAGLKLQAIGISPKKITKGMDVLRNMKSLKRVCTTPQTWGMMYQKTPWIPVKKFWAAYDKKKSTQ